MPDAIFEHPRLVAVYDAIEGERHDLAAYVSLAAEQGARRVLDVGCGTGSLALLLAAQGLDVTGVDPAAASLALARTKPGAGWVRWLAGDATTLPDMQVDLATMTGNAAQAVLEPGDWGGLLDGVHRALRPGGHFVVETRDPATREWQEWTPENSFEVTEVAGIGTVESWDEVVDVRLPLVSFVSTRRFLADGASVTSTSTLRFRERDEIAADLQQHGFLVAEVRQAPDRPGKEFVFIAERPAP